MEQGSVNRIPNKPELYDGRRDSLTVNTWIYKMEQYLVLMEVTNPQIELNDVNRILFASTFLSNTAAVWWYTLVQTGSTPNTWNEFKAAMVKAFVPEDHVRRARDKLRRLKQTKSVANYLSEFRNIVLTVPDITDNEKWGKFCAGLKYDVRLEVMKATVTSFDEAAKIALRVDSALWAAGTYNNAGTSASSSSSVNGPDPMEIGNMEKRSSRGQRMDPQRLKDLRINACFVCYAPGCRPWKHGKAAVANVEVDEACVDVADDDSAVKTGN